MNLVTELLVFTRENKVEKGGIKAKSNGLVRATTLLNAQCSDTGQQTNSFEIPRPFVFL